MITVILGMHRSGTSTIAGILHLNNIIMGTYKTFWPRPLSQNPKGFYENYDFRKINDSLLKKVNYNVESLEPTIPNIIFDEKLSSKMEKLILKSNKENNDWGWKDPRTCLTINSWIQIFKNLKLEKEVKIIFVSRKAISVARSLNKRNDLPLEKGVELWETYTDRALDFCTKSKYKTFYCTFEELLINPNFICEKLFYFLNRKWDPLIVDKFVDKSISKSGMGRGYKQSNKITLLENKIDLLLS